ncbi:MAG: L,D-transpeptidase [Gammaproteobacteria bacterium]|nr:L,D-transpeptidase [Gammaproteobacteria bacterium]
MALRIDIFLDKQTLELSEGDTLRRRYTVSTAANGAGETMGSECTPRGLHRIADCIGADAPVNAVFVARQLTGEIYTPSLKAADPTRDFILTRILRLAGCEPGRNCGGQVDSFARYIYIHGTPDDEPMGVPRSHGCIRMRNADIVDLFAQVGEGVPVHIHPSRT